MYVGTHTYVTTADQAFGLSCRILGPFNGYVSPYVGQVGSTQVVKQRHPYNMHTDTGVLGVYIYA